MMESDSEAARAAPATAFFLGASMWNGFSWPANRHAAPRLLAHIGTYSQVANLDDNNGLETRMKSSHAVMQVTDS